VIHWAKLSPAAGSAPEFAEIDTFWSKAWVMPVAFDSVVFHLGTCQRKLWVFDEEALAEKMG
jgi:hypothetical protein